MDILVLAVISIFALLFIWMAYEGPAIAVTVITAVFCWEVIHDALGYAAWGPLFTLGPFAIYTWDAVFACLAPVAAVKTLEQSNFSRHQVIWFVFLGVFIVAMIRGVAVYGFQPAGLEARSLFYFVVGTTYFSATLKTKRSEAYAFRFWLLAALLIAVVFCLQFLIGGLEQFQRQLGRLGDSATFMGLRSFNASAAFVIAQAAMISLYLWLYRSGPKHWQMAGLVIFLPAATLLLHRSVLIALVIMLISVCVMERQRSKFLVGLAVGYPFVTTFVILFLMLLNIPILESFVTATAEPFKSDSTFLWRYGIWIDTIGVVFSNDILGVLVGRPFGFGQNWTLLTGQPVAHTHNFYLYTALYGGIFGMIVVLSLYWRLLRSLVSQTFESPELNPASRLVAVLLIGQLVFYMGYGANPEQSIIAGMAIAMAKRKRASLPGADRAAAATRPAYSATRQI